MAGTNSPSGLGFFARDWLRLETLTLGLPGFLDTLGLAVDREPGNTKAPPEVSGPLPIEWVDEPEEPE